MGKDYCLGTGGVVALLFGAAALAQTSRSQLGSGFQIQYGVVEHVEVSQVDPTAAPGQGATIGGMLGYVSGRNRSAGRAAGGAAAGALISNAIARNQKANAPNAYTYTILLPGGATARVVTETGGIDEGDCVSLESGDTMNVRRVSSAFCEEPEQVADPLVSANAQEDAAECQTAKEAALNATTEEQMAVAYKKVRLFCES